MSMDPVLFVFIIAGTAGLSFIAGMVVQCLFVEEKP